ncbi:DEAH-box RNA-dependent ATPase PRP2 SCDLUD_001203 [Saccharomycodes ludwigii]|uniref:DEAH-box RNA-dependent ATPase PRP2 n=1 Tax=Saccharomycodes ludwigii TaxID=36035 RepID=UPI001E81D4EE|nr:hypothetical protein SCDLUD_001203 [Saccharomycodes ludwigii]KAH3903561.1 hypothetical protein SCDLUD_001203 [Saccharomycodes ludwigii]
MTDSSGRKSPISLTGEAKKRVKRVFNEINDKYELPQQPNLLQKPKQQPTPHILNTKKTDKIQKAPQDESLDNLRVLVKKKYLNKKENMKLQKLVESVHKFERDELPYLTHSSKSLPDQRYQRYKLQKEIALLYKDKGVTKSKYEANFHLPDEKGNFGTVNDKLNKKGAEQWELLQLKQATQNLSTDEIYVKGSDKYEYVFDKETFIDFTPDNENVDPGANFSDDPASKQDLELPITKMKPQLLEAIDKNQVLIVVGETGSGKTTQLPQYLVLDRNWKVACTQPRRVAATSVAKRVSEEMNVELGQEVGYTIRFDDKSNEQTTVLKYVTDGMLLREFLADSKLLKYDCIMIDEAHERTLSTDVLLGLLKELLKSRPLTGDKVNGDEQLRPLRLIISSATMNASKFSEFFDGARLFNVPGRRFPVDIHYTLQPEANYIQAVLTTIFQIHLSQPVPGDILVFLTGQDEIEYLNSILQDINCKLQDTNCIPMLITPIYGNLPQDQQAEIFKPTPAAYRKVVLATNIAETSLTINGIKYVIDPGFVKIKTFIPQTGMSQLSTVPCSKASVDQRAGRAGRVGPGKCFRIFTKWSYEHELELLPQPEISRTNISSVILLLMSLGVKNLLDFPLLDRPSIPQLSKGLENLYLLGGLNSKGQITHLGYIMNDFPCEPNFLKVLYVAADKFGVLEPVLTIVAMLHETQALFSNEKNLDKASMFPNVVSDHMLLLNIYNAWKENNCSKSWCVVNKIQSKTMSRVENIRKQLWRYCKNRSEIMDLNNKHGNNMVGCSPISLESCIIKSFISGFPNNIAIIGRNGQYKQQNNSNISMVLHPTSLISCRMKTAGMKPYKIILYHQLIMTSKEFMRDCTPVYKEEWLKEMVPQFFVS